MPSVGRNAGCWLSLIISVCSLILYQIMCIFWQGANYQIRRKSLALEVEENGYAGLVDAQIIPNFQLARTASQSQRFSIKKAGRIIVRKREIYLACTFAKQFSPLIRAENSASSSAVKGLEGLLIEILAVFIKLPSGQSLPKGISLMISAQMTALELQFLPGLPMIIY